MVRFFRKIRQNLLSKNELSKYLFYAIGEIVLVVIGILIALSIDNWNEERINDEKESLLIKNIIKDLHLDEGHISETLDQLEEQLNAVDSLIAKALDPSIEINFDYMGIVRYASDIQPIAQRNHIQSVSGLENESNRKMLQDYFFKEDQALDIFMEYKDIIHHQLRPYLRETGMHNLNALYAKKANQRIQMLLDPSILETQLMEVTFQQLLFERRLKTESFIRVLKELKTANQNLIKNLNTNSS